MLHLSTLLLCIVIGLGKEVHLDEILKSHSCEEGNVHCLNKRQSQFDDLLQCPWFLDTTMNLFMKPGSANSSQRDRYLRLPVNTVEFYEVHLDDKTEKKTIIADVIAGSTDEKILFEDDHGKLATILIKPYSQNGGKLLLCAKQQYKALREEEMKACFNCQFFKIKIQQIQLEAHAAKFKSNLYDIEPVETTRTETTIRYDFGQLPLKIEQIVTKAVEVNSDPRCARWTSNKLQFNKVYNPSQFSAEATVVRGLVAKKEYAIESQALVQRPDFIESELPEELWIKHDSGLKILKGECGDSDDRSIDDKAYPGAIDHQWETQKADSIVPRAGVFSLICVIVSKLLMAA